MSEDKKLYIYLSHVHKMNLKWTSKALKEIFDNFPTINKYEITCDTYSPEDDKEKYSWWLQDLARFQPSYSTRVIGYQGPPPLEEPLCMECQKCTPHIIFAGKPLHKEYICQGINWSP